MDNFDAGMREQVNEMLGVAQDVMMRDRDVFGRLIRNQGLSPAEGSRGADDLLELRWRATGSDEPLALATVHRVGTRLMMIENMLDGLIRLLHDHAPIYTLEPLVRTAIVAAARIHAVVSPDDDVERAAQALLDWTESYTQQERVLEALPASARDRSAIQAELKRLRGWRQRRAARYGFVALKNGWVGLDVGAARRNFKRVEDGDAISALMRPTIIDLTDPGNPGWGLVAWRRLSAVIHADPLAIQERVTLAPASDHDRPEVQSETSAQLSASAVGVTLLLVHAALTDLLRTLGTHWGWHIAEAQLALRDQGHRLIDVYLPDPDQS